MSVLEYSRIKELIMSNPEKGAYQTEDKADATSHPEVNPIPYRKVIDNLTTKDSIGSGKEKHIYDHPNNEEFYGTTPRRR